MVEGEPSPAEIQRSLISLAKKLEVLQTDKEAVANRIAEQPGILRSLGITEDEVKALTIRAFGVLQAGSYPQAEESFALLTLLVPGHPYFLQGRGVACLLQDKLEEAEKFIRQSIAASDKEPSYYVNLGEVLYRQGKAQEAFEAFRVADELDPEKKDFLVNRARSVLEMAARMAQDPELREAVAAELAKRKGQKVPSKGSPAKGATPKGKAASGKSGATKPSQSAKKKKK
jgi:Flp pilus assembly protein TadD